jgi:hypothetical protein
MDKTSGIKTELEKMVANGEIDASNLEQIKEIIVYLSHNNIFIFEKGENIVLLPKEIVEILCEARQRYFSAKKKLSDATFKVRTDDPIDFGKIREFAHEQAAKEILSKDSVGEDE